MGNQLIAPSILSADFSDLKSDIYMVNDSEAESNNFTRGRYNFLW